MVKIEKSKWAIAAVVAVLAIGALVGWYAPKQAGAQMPGGEMPPMPVNVNIMQPEEVRIWKEFPGRLTAVDSAIIRPQVSGRITEIHFQDGQSVEEGELLFVIDPRPYEAALSQAKALLQAAQSNYKQAQNDFERAEELVKTNALSERIYDERRARRNFVLAEINGAKATLEQAELDLEYAYVKAPISGRVGRAELTVGNLVEAGPGAPAVTEIVADEKIYVDFEVDEQTYLSHVREQAKDIEQEAMIPVQVVLRGDQDHAIDGVIHAFDNRIDPTSGTIRARAILKNENGTLLPGMFAKVRLGSAERDEAVLVNEKAISTDQDRKFVYVVEEGAVSYRQISLGDRVGHKRVVKDGLQAGDQVIINGILKLRPGMAVAPTVKESEKAQAPESPMPAPPAAEETEPVEVLPEGEVFEAPVEDEAMPEAEAAPEQEEPAEDPLPETTDEL